MIIYYYDRDWAALRRHHHNILEFLQKYLYDIKSTNKIQKVRVTHSTMARFTMALNSVFVLLFFSVLSSTDAFPNSKLRTSPLDSLIGLSANKGDRTRRDLLFEAGGLALSSLVLGQALPAFAEGSDPQTIVVTGANSGIGFDACKRLAQQGHNLVLACRTMEKSRETADRLKDLGGNLITAECDLASFASIKAFADKLPSLVGNKKIDCLCLNAGLARNTASTDVARTADGFELTGKLPSRLEVFPAIVERSDVTCMHKHLSHPLSLIPHLSRYQLFWSLSPKPAFATIDQSIRRPDRFDC
jgi:hypothetical protein